MMTRALALCSFPCLLFAACSSGGDETDGGMVVDDRGMMEEQMDATGFPDAPRIDRGVPIDLGLIDTGEPPDAGMDDDNDFATARTVVFNDNNGLDGVIDPAGDVDFAKVEIPGETWIVFDIAANDMRDPDKLDSVITIYDSMQRQIAVNDDQIFTTNQLLDSEVVFHATEAGTYYIKVEDWSTWAAQTPVGGPLRTYKLSVFNNFNAQVVNVETESGDDPASALNIQTNMGFAYAIGTYRDRDDIDVFKIVVPGTDPVRYAFHVCPSGTEGFGGVPTGNAWITDEAGTNIIARLDLSTPDYDELDPQLQGGMTYLLQVQHPAMTATTANDFYVFKMNAFTENDPKIGEPGNSTMMGAEALTLMPPAPDAAFFSGHIEDMDVDYFKVTIPMGQTLSIACGSASGGSGVQNLTMEVLTSTGGVLRTLHEMPPDNLFLPAASLTSTGTLYLKVTKDAQDPEIVGDWYRCAARGNM